jgi:hypothetical protein
MRTKTLLLTAALSVAGVATSMAQSVYSVNAVGYVNTTLVPGLSLISNPLDAGAGKNTIAALFTDAAKAAAAGIQIYKFIPGPAPTYKIFSWDNDFQEWDRADAATETLLPGEGVFVRNPTATAKTVTFVGEVPQGTLNNPLPQGLSIKSSMVPQAGTATALGYVPAAGDQVYVFQPNQQYYISSWDADFNEFDRPLTTLKVGEAFFLRRGTAGTWTRTFTVNPAQ